MPLCNFVPLYGHQISAALVMIDVNRVSNKCSVVVMSMFGPCTVRLKA